MVGVLVEVGEERGVVDALERGAAVLDGVEQAFGAVEVQLASDERGAFQRGQVRAERGQRERAVVLADDAFERQAAEDARQGVGVDVQLVREGGAGLRLGQRLGDAELRGHVQQLRRDEAVHEAEQLPRVIGHANAGVGGSAATCCCGGR